MRYKVIHSGVYVCYACNIDVTGAFRNDGQMMSAFHEYERAVEFIESLPVGAVFNRMSVWRATGQGISNYHLVYHAIRDMFFHGILECVQQSNIRCLKYRVKEKS